MAARRVAASRVLIVVKLGGSLNRDPRLRDWLQLLSTDGRGRAVIVPGGGGFADQVREHQALWQFDDLAAHNMAILAMMQTGTMYCSLVPGLQSAAMPAEITEVLRQGRVAVWRPASWIRTQPDEMTSWSATSDSLAAWLAGRLDATALVLVKAADLKPTDVTCADPRSTGMLPERPHAGFSCPHAQAPSDRAATLAQHAEIGLIDAAFCRLTGNATYSIELLGKGELARMQALLRSLPGAEPSAPS